MLALLHQYFRLQACGSGLLMKFQRLDKSHVVRKQWITGCFDSLLLGEFRRSCKPKRKKLIAGISGAFLLIAFVLTITADWSLLVYNQLLPKWWPAIQPIFVEFPPNFENSADEYSKFFSLNYINTENMNQRHSAANINQGDKSEGEKNISVKCSLVPTGSIGKSRIWLDAPTIDKLIWLYPQLLEGRSRPPKCQAHYRVALVVPYRDRDLQLRIFLHNMHYFLAKQQLEYGIFIIEQVHNQTFNRGKLLNVGFVEAFKAYNWDCVVFHDVDLLPEVDLNIYSCPEPNFPRHLSAAIDKFQYRLPYRSLFGGATALLHEQFMQMNGFSNEYWGWGGEDDDLSTRLRLAGYSIARYPIEIARYTMISHNHESANLNKLRWTLMRNTTMHWQKDGLNTLEYKLIEVNRTHLFTRILVDLLK